MKTPAPHISADPPENDAPSDEGRVRLLTASFTRLRVGVLAMPFIGLLFALLFAWQGGNPAGLLAWSALYLPALWGVRRLHRRYLQDQAERTAADVLATWQRRLQKVALCHGLALASTVALTIDGATYDFMLLLHVTLMGIAAINAVQMTANLPMYRAQYLGMASGLALMPWAFPDHWYFALPMAVVMNIVIYQSSLSVQRFFVRQVVLEERSRDLADRYRVASSAALDALAEKNHFLGAAAHDLRQPVHAMALLAEAIALHGQHDARLATLLQQWRQSMRSVNHMFNTLLDLSRIESGTMQARPSPVSVAQLLDEVGLQFGEDARARGLALRLRPAPPDALLWADPALVRQALFNLVHNALRYTTHGGVLVAARRRGEHWRISVWDTGMGVAAQEHERIFDAFYRGEGADAAVRSGHGLGLAVVARCVALMNARQGLRSRPGQGSAFWLEVPAAARPDFSTASPARVPDMPAWAPLHGQCLVLDDEPQVLKAWAALLGGWGLQLRTASSARQAFAHLDGGFMPDVVFCDQHLGHGGSGFAVLQVLLERCPAARGAMVSGEFDAPALHDAQEQGFLVLRKPVDPQTLHEVLSRWLDTSHIASRSIF
ncbi:MAG: hybrid sensor histidine kinase/response regulator [Acidovorax sp.]|uniref:ATP-binding response regulator n=1 Tax=Acidovorax sp. TaxID=1872122 RepID=UPI002628E2EB|nr:hybrid sensor histidine kinase/response regulator [Acidovorax sp.]MDH4427764.1 hybrid sensor histidine kinase/response regulator [Acidovorax sp.]MDH4464528.1 hybrid sensor histidine kinase/response regulator [Acidovorax sp.]